MNEIPDEVLIEHLFPFFQKKEIVQLYLVNQRFNGILNSEIFNKRICKLYYPEMQKEFPPKWIMDLYSGSFKTIFLSSHPFRYFDFKSSKGITFENAKEIKDFDKKNDSINLEEMVLQIMNDVELDDKELMAKKDKKKSKSLDFFFSETKYSTEEDINDCTLYIRSEFITLFKFFNSSNPQTIFYYFYLTANNEDDEVMFLISKEI